MRGFAKHQRKRDTFKYHAFFMSGFMANEVKNIHIGNLIRKELDRQRHSIPWFAQQIPCDRSNVYRMFQKQSLEADVLFRISQILKTDFFKYYSKQLKPLSQYSQQSDATSATQKSFSTE